MNYRTSTGKRTVREFNLSQVLRLIHNEAPISRALIAQKTGLNKSTVSSLADALCKQKLIHEIGITSTKAGRPARLLEINPHAGSIIGVEFGVDHVSTVLTDFAGKILWKKHEPTDMLDPMEKTLEKSPYG